MPLLSICIPTYNRSDELRRTLDSIVCQDRFANTDDVEIVVSDNCSTDDTPSTIREYTSRFPTKIHSHRTKENIGFGNFLEVLSFGAGDFLKLNNDTLMHNPGSLDGMCEAIHTSRQAQDILFFPNGSAPRKEQRFTCTNLDAFIRDISYWNTWIAAFGIWKTDLKTTLELFSKTRQSEIPQTHVLFHLISVKHKSLIVNEPFFSSIPPKQKKGYNIAEVFLHNYNTLLKQYADIGKISKSTLRTEKRRILTFATSFYFDRSPMYAFTKSGYWKYFWPHYKTMPCAIPMAVAIWLLKSVLGIHH